MNPATDLIESLKRRIITMTEMRLSLEALQTEFDRMSDVLKDAREARAEAEEKLNEMNRLLNAVCWVAGKGAVCDEIDGVDWFKARHELLMKIHGGAS